MKLWKGAGLIALIAFLAACEREEILPGERLPLRGEEAAASETASAEPLGPRPISLPAPSVTSDWTHEAGGPLHRVRHPALAASLSRAWSVDIGQGNSRRHRITADPIVGGGRIFTLDSRSTVTATSTGGEVLWRRDLTPAAERADDATGGGLALSGSRLYATTGFGTLSALDAATGRVIWTQSLDAPATGSPTVRDGLVYAVSRDNRAWAIDAENGRVRWEIPGAPSPAGRVGGAGPAVTDRLAIFPFATGELVATLRQAGVRVWASAVSGGRLGRAYASVTDITGDPVVAGDTVYSGNQSGRTVALDTAAGTRRWTADYGALGPVWVTGGSVFLVSDQNELVRLDAETGRTIWSEALPFFRNTRPKRRDAIYAHYGPVLAGGRLLVASSDRLIRAFDPESGQLAATFELPDAASSNMAVVNRTLYLVTANGQLHAFR